MNRQNSADSSLHRTQTLERRGARRFESNLTAACCGIHARNACLQLPLVVVFQSYPSTSSRAVIQPMSMVLAMHINQRRTEISRWEQCPPVEKSLFEDFQAADVMTASFTPKHVVHEKGGRLFDADERATSVHFVLAGAVKLHVMTPHGRDRTLHVAGTGDTIGYRGVIAGDVNAVSATALERTTTHVMRAEIFLRILDDNPRLARRVMLILSEDLRHAEESSVHLVCRSLPSRIAEAILSLKASCGLERDNATLRVSLTRVELGNIVGAAPESVSRTLSRLRENQILVVRGARIKLLDERSLVRTAASD